MHHIKTLWSIDFHSCVSGKDWCTSEVITKVNDLHHNHPKWLPWWQMELHDCEEHLWWIQQYGWMLLVGQYYQRVGWTRILTNKAWWWLGAIPTNKAVAVDNEHRSIGHNWGSVGQLDYRKLSGWSYNSTQLVNLLAKPFSNLSLSATKALLWETEMSKVTQWQLKANQAEEAVKSVSARGP